MRSVLVTLAAAAAVGTALSGCGGDGAGAASYPAGAVAACAGVATGAEALEADGRPPERRVQEAMRRATAAARALAQVGPPDELAERHGEAVHALQVAAGRLRAVRDQIDRGARPGPVLSAARASLEDGDRLARGRLAAIGVDCAAPSRAR